jgi:alpha-tubulin suppressor-like RCC1 family protein
VEVFMRIIIKENTIPVTKKVVQVSCGFGHTVVFLEDGTLWGAGDNSMCQLGLPTSNSNADVFTPLILKKENNPVTKKVVQVS